MVKDWTRVEGDIRQLYYVQNKPLSEVIPLIRERHKFIASERAYRTQLQKWGLAKYSTQACPAPGQALDFSRSTAKTASTTLAHGGLSLADNTEEVVLSDSPPYTGDKHAYPGDSSVTLIADRQSRTIEPDHLRSSLGIYPPNHQSQTLLHRAVIEADLQQVVELLSAGCPANAKDVMGNTPLHCAAAIGSASIVRRLVQAGSQGNAQNRFGYSPLHIACKSAIVELLLGAGANQGLQDTLGNTPLHLRLSAPFPEGEEEEMVTVIDKLVQSTNNLNLANKLGVTPFHLLVDLPYYSKNSEPLLQQPTWVLRCIKLFLDRGANPTVSLRDLRTPLQVFIAKVHQDRTFNAGSFLWEDHIEYVLLHRFLANGASPLTLMSNGTCIVSHYFREYFNAQENDTLATLFIQSTSPTAPLSDGCTILHELCKKASAQKINDLRLQDMVRTVLAQGANPNTRDITLSTPLMLSLSSSCGASIQVLDVMKILLDHGAYPSLSGPNGDCAVFQAIILLGEDGKDLVIAMLQADFRTTTNRIGYLEYGGPRSRRFWDSWNYAKRANDWLEASRSMMGMNADLPDDKQMIVQQCALVVLAEHYLDKLLLARPYTGLQMIEQRTKIACILNDCRSHGVTVDMKYYDKLVQCCL